MNTSANDARATAVWLDADRLWVRLEDGRELGVPLAYFPRLLRATPEQRQGFTTSGGGTGLHWEGLDEDISVPSLLAGFGDMTRQGNQACGAA